MARLAHGEHVSDGYGVPGHGVLGVSGEAPVLVAARTEATRAWISADARQGAPKQKNPGKRTAYMYQVSVRVKRSGGACRPRLAAGRTIAHGAVAGVARQAAAAGGAARAPCEWAALGRTRCSRVRRRAASEQQIRTRSRAERGRAADRNVRTQTPSIGPRKPGLQTQSSTEVLALVAVVLLAGQARQPPGPNSDLYVLSGHAASSYIEKNAAFARSACVRDGDAREGVAW